MHGGILIMITFKKSENKKLGKYFKTKEFICSCGKCKDQFISPQLIEKLDEVREKFGKPIKITSGYRCPEHNVAIGGKVGSSHVSGLAADIQPVLLTLDDLDLLYEICYNVFDNVGDGRNKNFIHVDVREPKKTGKRHWLYL
jgi:uncharacterized protein YcbK (DUF882 family)